MGVRIMLMNKNEFVNAVNLHYVGMVENELNKYRDSIVKNDCNGFGVLNDIIISFAREINQFNDTANNYDENETFDLYVAKCNDDNILYIVHDICRNGYFIVNKYCAVHPVNEKKYFELFAEYAME